MEREVVLRVQHLKKYFPVREGLLKRTQGYVKAVDGVSFEIHKGETLGLVGESGCGKTTTARAILQLDPPTAGSVILEGRELIGMNGEDLRSMRTKMQIIFQDPYSSLNPRITVGMMLTEPMMVHGMVKKNKEARERARELLAMVRLNPHFLSRFPVEFSGGQRQRVGIARALSVNPSFIICDEPISSVDVSIQAQLVNLLRRLQRELNLTYLFISHDLSMTRYISDRMAVMYLGKIVELGRTKVMYESPLHPYTEALWSAVPVPHPEIEQTRERITLEGDVPSPINPPLGCNFSTRCSRVMGVCKNTEPQLKEVDRGHFVACHLY